MKGQRVVEVDAQLIVELLKGCAPGRGLEVTKDALPDDAEVECATYDAMTGSVQLHLTSEEWTLRPIGSSSVRVGPPTMKLTYGSSMWNYPLTMWADRARGLFGVLRGSEAPQGTPQPMPPLVVDWGGLLDRLWSARQGQAFLCPFGEGCTLQTGRVGVDHAVFHRSPTQPAASFVIDEGSNLTATPETLLAFVRRCHTPPKAIEWDNLWHDVQADEAPEWSCPLGTSCSLKRITRDLRTWIVHRHPDDADQLLPIPGNDAISFEYFIRRCHRDTTLPY